MEIYFVNRCVRTQKMEREIESCSFWSRRDKILFLFCFLFFLACSILFAKSEKTFGSILGTVLTVIILFSYFEMPRSKAKQAYRRMCNQLHTDKPEFLASFSNENVEWLTVQTRGKVSFSYIQFTECIKLKHLYLLTVALSEGQPELTLVLSKAGFENGDSNDFTGFLKERCPGIKFRSYKCL